MTQPSAIPTQPVHRQPGGTLELRCHKSGTLESVKNQKTLPSVDQPPLGLSLSTSTPLFKKKAFVEPQREARGANLDFDKSKNGKYLFLESYYKTVDKNDVFIF